MGRNKCFIYLSLEIPNPFINMANHTRKYSINTNTDSLRQLKANEKSKNNVISQTKLNV